MPDTLHILLEGPFVLCDDDDKFRILVPDLLDSHHKPGFVASRNSADLENGIWKVEISPRKKKLTEARVPANGPFDRFCCPRPVNAQAYAILELPTPDCVEGLSTTDATISSDFSPPPKGVTSFSTKAVLVYHSVDLATLKIDHVVFKPEDNSEVRAIDNVGLLIFEMKPLQDTDLDHARMAYRAMARMVGLNRFMKPVEVMHFGPHDDCRAALMLVDHP